MPWIFFLYIKHHQLIRLLFMGQFHISSAIWLLPLNICYRVALSIPSDCPGATCPGDVEHLPPFFKKFHFILRAVSFSKATSHINCHPLYLFHPRLYGLLARVYSNSQVFVVWRMDMDGWMANSERHHVAFTLQGLEYQQSRMKSFFYWKTENS